MKKMYPVLALILFVSILNAFEIPFSTTPIKTDVNLITGFLRITPNDQKAETLPTQAWLWYDEDNMYCRIECLIDSTFTIGQYASRDCGTQGDYLYFTIMTNPVSYSEYIYTATPTGALMEGTGDINGNSYDWDSSYSYTTDYNDTLWTVVFSVPFSEMRFKANPPYNWKVTFSRYHEQSRDDYVYPFYNNKIAKDYYYKAKEIVLTHKIKRRSDWKFKPYFVKSYDLVDDTSTFDPENVGLDISFNPDTKTKMKIAVNPDFTNVPPDDADDIYNNKYPVYLWENRFFFIEDIDAFGVDSNIFYTRNIVQPQYAVKFTGRQDTWTYGYLCAKDKRITEAGYNINTDDFYQLMAVTRQTPKYKVHFASAGRMNKDYYNHFILGNWDWEFIRNMHIGSSHLYSFRDDERMLYTDEQYLGGLYQSAYLDLNPGNWNINAEYTNLQKDVTLDMGYLYETGYENYDFGITWRSDVKEKFIRMLYLINNFNYSNKLEANKPLNYVGGGSTFLIGFLPKYSLLTQIWRSRPENDGKMHDTYHGVLRLQCFKWQIYRPSFYIAKGKTIIYSLNETKDFTRLTHSFSGSLKRNLSWSSSLSHYDYGYDKVNYLYTPTDTLIIKLDDSYQIANFSLYYDFSNTMSLSNGLGISTYKSGSRYSNLTFYSNFRYELKKDWFLYLGYKTGQSQDEPSTTNDFLGHFNRNSASAYLKLSATI